LENCLSKDFDENNIDKIFQEITDKLNVNIPNINEQKIELSIKDLLSTQKSLMDALSFVNSLVFSLVNETDLLEPDSESTKYLYDQISSIYKLVEDFNDYMVQFLGEDIEFIFEFDDDEEEEEDDY
jgi:hypothetical protein